MAVKDEHLPRQAESVNKERRTGWSARGPAKGLIQL